MGYIEKNLMMGEKLLYSSNLHWIIFIWPIIWFMVAIYFFITGGETAVIGSLFVIISIVTFIGSYINYTTAEFGITNKRVIVKVGFIRRNSLEVFA